MNPPRYITKITPGFVEQVYDTKTDEWICQEFVKGDDSFWDDSEGNLVDEPKNIADQLPLDMVQPITRDELTVYAFDELGEDARGE